MHIDTSMSRRIPYLRDYYMTYAPLSVERDLVPWLCHRTKLLYAEGWLETWMLPQRVCAVQWRKSGCLSIPNRSSARAN